MNSYLAGDVLEKSQFRSVLLKLQEGLYEDQS